MVALLKISPWGFRVTHSSHQALIRTSHWGISCLSGVFQAAGMSICVTTGKSFSIFCICVCIWIWIMLRINKRCVSVSLWPPLAGPLTGSGGRGRTNHHGSISTTASVSPSSFILVIIVDWLFWSYYCFWCIFPLSAHSGTQSSMPGLCSITGNGAPLCLSPLFWTLWWDIILRNRQA